MKLAICVPVYAPHLKFLPELFESIANQTVKPSLISISISSCAEPTVLPPTVAGIPLLVTSTHKQQFASANRNAAAEQALGVESIDGIVFFDADDYMHPQYIEKVQDAFQEGADVFLHNYANWPGRQHATKQEFLKSSLETPTTYQSYFHEEHKPEGFGQISPYDDQNNLMDIANGHVSIKRFVFEREKFTRLQRGEDCDYNYRLLKSGYNVMASKDKLSLYAW